MNSRGIKNQLDRYSSGTWQKEEETEQKEPRGVP